MLGTPGAVVIGYGATSTRTAARAAQSESAHHGSTPSFCELPPMIWSHPARAAHHVVHGPATGAPPPLPPEALPCAPHPVVRPGEAEARRGEVPREGGPRQQNRRAHPAGQGQQRARHRDRGTQRAAAGSREPSARVCARRTRSAIGGAGRPPSRRVGGRMGAEEKTALVLGACSAPLVVLYLSVRLHLSAQSAQSAQIAPEQRNASACTRVATPSKCPATVAPPSLVAIVVGRVLRHGRRRGGGAVQYVVVVAEQLPAP